MCASSPPGPCDERTPHRAQPSSALNAGRSALETCEWLSDGISSVEKLYDLLSERRRLKGALDDKLKAASRLEAWAADGASRTRAFAATGIAVSAPSKAEPASMPRERTEAPPRVPSLQHSLIQVELEWREASSSNPVVSILLRPLNDGASQGAEGVGR